MRTRIIIWGSVVILAVVLIKWLDSYNPPRSDLPPPGYSSPNWSEENAKHQLFDRRR